LAIEDSAAQALIFDPRLYSERAAKIQERVPGCLLLSLGPGGIGKDLCALAAAARPAPLIAPQVTADDPYRLSYSGGTTGRPKAVIGTQRTGAAVLMIQLAEWECLPRSASWCVLL